MKLLAFRDVKITQLVGGRAGVQIQILSKSIVSYLIARLKYNITGLAFIRSSIMLIFFLFFFSFFPLILGRQLNNSLFIPLGISFLRRSRKSLTQWFLQLCRWWESWWYGGLHTPLASPAFAPLPSVELGEGGEGGGQKESWVYLRPQK